MWGRAKMESAVRAMEQPNLAFDKSAHHRRCRVPSSFRFSVLVSPALMEKGGTDLDSDIVTAGLSLYRSPECKKPNRDGWAKCKKRYKIRWLLDLGSNQGPAD